MFELGGGEFFHILLKLPRGPFNGLMGAEDLPRGLKRPRRDVDHLPSSRAEVRNEQKHILTLHSASKL